MSKKQQAKPKTKILIVDDHPMMRQGLAQLINNEPDLVVSGEAETAEKAVEAVGQQKPDLVLIDITLPGRSGLELVKDLHTLDPALQILVISMHDESLYAERVLRAGARGYIMKQEGGRQIMQAIRQVLNGQIYVSPKMSSKILEIFSGRRKESTSSPMEQLTDREFEVFQLIGQGRSTRQIAEQLHLSVKTVEVHRQNMKQKLALSDGPSLVRAAIRWVEGQSST